MAAWTLLFAIARLLALTMNVMTSYSEQFCSRNYINGRWTSTGNCDKERSLENVISDLKKLVEKEKREAKHSDDNSLERPEELLPSHNGTNTSVATQGIKDNFSAVATTTVSASTKIDYNFTTPTSQSTTASVGMTKEGWYRVGNGYEYKYIGTSGTYDQTTAWCKGMDASATLAAAGVRDQTLNDNKVMKALGVPASAITIWVGATDILDGLTWRFQDGVSLLAKGISWGRGTHGPIEPSGGEHCMNYFVPASPNTNIPGPNDATCTAIEPYICERQIAQ